MEILVGNIEGRILMIDDDEKFCELLRDFLKLHGFILEYVNSWLEAIEKIKENEFQAVILDAVNLEIEGGAIINRIRQISALPVLMFTALGDESNRVLGREIGADY